MSGRRPAAPRRALRAEALAAAALALAAGAARGQGLVEAADGSTSVLLRSGAQVSANFGDKSVRFALLRRLSTRAFLYGGEVKLVATDGVARLVKGGFAPPETHASVTLGLQGEPDTVRIPYHRLFVRPRLVYLGTAVADTAGGLALRKRSSTTLDVTVGYNQFLHVAGAVSAVWGVAATWGGRNDYAELAAMRLCTQVASGGGQVLQDCQDVRLGPAHASESWSVDLDAALFPGWGGAVTPLGFAGFVHVNAPRDRHRVTPGVGLLFSKPGAALAVVGALTLEWGTVARVGAQVGVPF